MKKLKSLWTITKLVPLFRLQWIFLTQGWSLRFCIAGRVVIAEPLGRSSVPLFPSEKAGLLAMCCHPGRKPVFHVLAEVAPGFQGLTTLPLLSHVTLGRK